MTNSSLDMAESSGHPGDKVSPHKVATLRQNRKKLVGLVLGPVLFIAIVLMPSVAGLPVGAQRMAAVAILMAVWWTLESAPIPVTSLLPIVLCPLLDIMPTAQVTARYGSPIIFMFMGAFIIALAMQRWNLHRRVALHIVKVVGLSAKRVVFGFMLATAVLSAFVSNTATAVMMMPVGLAIIGQMVEGAALDSANAQTVKNFSLNLMLGIAYAATIGGMATLVGTPPNAVFAGYMQSTYGYEISFYDWAKLGVPLALVLIPLTWWWLTSVMNPMRPMNFERSRQVIDLELAEMGAMSRGEMWTAVIFGATAFGWIFKGQLNSLVHTPSYLTDANIAIAGALALFLVPLDWRRGEFVMNWEWAVKLPWDVLILFGGGLALAGGFTESGLSSWIGGQAEQMGHWPTILFITSVVTLIIFLTELTSNTATAAMIIPILAAIAIGLNQNPLLLVIPATLAASCAFMLPVATPPNAIVFGSGHVTIPEMSRSGVGLNVIGVAVVVGATFAIAFSVFEIQEGVLPLWAAGQ